MIPSIIRYATLMVMISMAASISVYAGDMDDGIEIDEKIEKYDALGEPGINIEYIKRSAKATADSGKSSSTNSGDTAIGSFINKPGAKVGNVTIIFNGEDITTVSE